MGKQLTFVRFDDYTLMRINEIVSSTGYNKSVVVRALVTKSLNDMTDQEGYIKDEKDKKRKG